MARKCLKCEYERRSTDNAPEYECPKCGAIYAKVEAAMRGHANFDNQLSNEEKLRAIKEQSALEQQKRSVEDSKESNKYSRRKKSTIKFTKANQFIAIAGSLFLLVGVFSPIVQFPIVGNINFYNQGQGDGVIVLAIAVLAIVFALTKHFRFHFYSGVVVLADLGYVILNFTVKMNEIKRQIDADMGGNPFRGLADAAMGSVQLQWGLALLLIGAGLLITSAFYRDKAANEKI
jgi:hypothetical protein